MRKLLILILICVAQSSFSQTQKTVSVMSDDENHVYNTAGIDVKPEFPGGLNEFYKYISQNYMIPKEKPAAIKGKVVATFVVEKDGSLNDIKIIKDVGFNTGTETIRVLKLSPKWISGKLEGQNVRVLYVIPITIN
ncbi:energy transducer TonB [Flavobacterium chungbukense]|uniref:TonB C-terminal domain-containing protein n=1 Tax=Flavobacterium chungbukense TaxID=877464 RepID=A0ABP7YQ86_9FLAO|nr:energy transducer TonB [Flavobacterium chungbukense]MCC4919605.1 energy transducer TonB [Flavobacterium chungbukense]